MASEVPEGTGGWAASVRASVHICERRVLDEARHVGSGPAPEPALVRARVRGRDRWEQSGSELLDVPVSMGSWAL